MVLPPQLRPGVAQRRAERQGGDGGAAAPGLGEAPVVARVRLLTLQTDIDAVDASSTQAWFFESPRARAAAPWPSS